MGDSRNSVSQDQHFARRHPTRGLVAVVLTFVVLMLALWVSEASAQQVLPQNNPWSWRAWMYSGGGDRIVEPDEQNRGVGASISRSLGEGAVIAGFRFGSNGSADASSRSARFSLTLPLSRARESAAPGPELGWRSPAAQPAAGYAPADSIVGRIIDPTVAAPHLDVLPYRDPENAGFDRIGVELLVPPPPLM